jgi:serine/threonine protein kinase/WD40 repeat protein
MSTEDRLKELFAQALQRTTPAQREQYLAEACEGDQELRRQVESLLAAHQQAGDFLGQTIKLPPPDFVIEPTGMMIGRYKLLEKIGEGGFGVVYMAEQQEPVKRKVALKVIKAGMDTREVIARFEAERQALALMDHPNIAKVLDGGATEAGRPYFVMELVRGIPITEYCDQSNLSTGERLQLFIKVCHAVQHAHQKAVIHRDLKPSNILITLHDGEPVPKVIDFGVAKALGQTLTEKTLFTAFRQMIGTPAYMSPEQAELSGLDVDTRSDVYSLGVLLYELLIGRTPFDANELLKAGLDEMRRRIREDEPLRPSTRLSTYAANDLTTVAKHRSLAPPKLISLIRGDLDWIVMKALEKDRTRRYETANGLAMDITRHLTQEPVQARPPSPLYRMQKLARRNRVAVAASSAIAGVLIVGAAVSAWQAVRATRAERHAKGEAAHALRAEKAALEKATFAENEQRRANESAEELRRNLYAADMSTVSQAWEQGDVGLMQKLLEMHRPKPGEPDLRGFEWFYFWKLSQGEQEELVPFETNETQRDRAIAMSADGTLIVIVRTNELQVHNWRRQQIIAKWSLPDRERWYERDGDISADNKFVATVEPDGLHLFEINTGHERILPTGNCDRVLFSPAGRLMALHLRPPDPSKPWSIRVWDYQTGTEVRSIVVAARFPFLDWSRDGKKLFTHGMNNHLTVEDIESGSTKSYDLGRFRDAQVDCVSPDARTLALGGSVIDLESQRVLVTSQGVPMWMATFSVDGRWLAGSGPSGQIAVWETATWKKVATLRGHSGVAWYLRFLPQNGRLLSWVDDGTIRVWNYEHAPESRTSVNCKRPMTVQFAPEGNLVSLVTTDWETALWDMKERRVKANVKGHGFAFSPDGRQLVVRTDARSLQVWDVEHLNIRHEFELASKTNFYAKLSPDGRFISYSDWIYDDLRVVDTSGKCVYSCERWYDWTFSPDSRLLAVNDSEYANDAISTLLLKDMTGPIERRVAHCGAMCLAFSPDGRFLAAGTHPPGVNLVDVAAGTVVAKLKGHLAPALAVAFSPDGKTLASGGQDRTIRLYNIATCRQVAVFQVSSTVYTLAFSPDGQTLVSGEDADETGSGHYRFWYAPRVDAPPLPLPALRPPASDSIWVTAPKLK